MKLIHLRLILTFILSAACVSVSFYASYKRQKSVDQGLILIHSQWQNQQLNQYLSQRLLLSPHREPMGLSQWSPAPSNSQSFCDAMQLAMEWPSQWTTLQSLAKIWQQRFALQNWLASLKQVNTVSSLIESAQIRIQALPSDSQSLCPVELSTKLGASDPIKTVLYFSNRQKGNLR